MERIYFKVSQWYNERVKIQDFKPDLRVRHVTEIEDKTLKGWAIKTILVDVDNTLVSKGSSQLEPQIVEWMDSQKKQGRSIVLCSNNVSSAALRIAKTTDLSAIRFALKPFTFRVKSLLKKQSYLSPVCVIGDQVFTDVWLGKRLSAHTILVDPIDQHDWLSTKVLRIVERFVLKDEK